MKTTTLAPHEIFVFGSNDAGRHGRGAAKDALKFGAIYGQGRGLAGQTYAIATKDSNLHVQPLHIIEEQIKLFLNVAALMPNKTFIVTPIGCGLAGYRPDQIAPLFNRHAIPPNVVMPVEFK